MADPEDKDAGQGDQSTDAPSGVAAGPQKGSKPGGSTRRPGGTSHRSTSTSGSLGRLFVDPQGQVYDWLAGNGGDAKAAMIRERIADQPQARWFATYNPDEIEGQVRDYTNEASSAGRTGVLVAYSMTNRDCGGASAGGAPDSDGYRGWISKLAAGIGNRRTIVVLEPDALPHLDQCLSEDQQQERLGLIKYAAQTLKSTAPNARIYYDVGNSTWNPAGEMADRAKAAGITEYGDGIALNTSNFNTTGSEVAYGKDLLAAIGDSGLRMVVDTSRNGAGKAGDGQWCDPAGRKLGHDPTTNTGDSLVAAYLWVKRPGESDGCSAGAGQFSPDTAYELSN
jgi:endoglucanase